MSVEKNAIKNCFQGISEESLREITNISKIQKIGSDETLESDVIDTICIVLEGELAVFSDQTSEKPLLTIPAGAFARQTMPRIVIRSEAGKSSIAMILSKKIADMLSENSQLFIYKHIYEFERQRISQCHEKLEKSEEKKAVIARAFKNSSLAASHNHSGFEPVQKVLKKVQKLPSSIEDIIIQFSSEKMTPKGLADLIKNDPSLTALILKRINSSYYSLGKKISDINYAIFYLGIDQIYQIIVSEGLRSSLSSSPEYQELYFHSVIISHISNEIARLAMTSQPAVASTTALLHDLGHNVIFILKEQNPKITELIDLLNPSELGSLLLKNWNMPEFISETTKYHMHPSFMPPEELPSSIKSAAVNLFVSHLVYDFIQKKPGYEISQAYTSECLDFLGWSGFDIKNVYEKILLPEFSKKISLYPESFKNFLTAVPDNDV